MLSPKSTIPMANVEAKTVHKFDEKEILEAEAEAEALEAAAARAAAEAEALAAEAAREEAQQKQNAIKEARVNVAAELARRMKTIQAKTAEAEEAATDVVPVAKKFEWSKQNVKSNARSNFDEELKQVLDRRQANKAVAEGAATDATNVVENVVPVPKKVALPTQHVYPNVPQEVLAELKQKLNAMRANKTRDPVSGSMASQISSNRLSRQRYRHRLSRDREGGIVTRKKYRRRNKRKTKHYKKKAKRYTKKRNRRY